MKNSELYFRTVDILLQAYFDHTLMHNTCWCCAVGNIVAANMGVKVYTDSRGKWSKGSPHWSDLVLSISSSIRPNAEKQVLSTGYSVDQLKQIEKAFENAPSKSKDDLDDEWMFNGLMAVIDVLDIIHENTDANVTSSTKQKFTHA